MEISGGIKLNRLVVESHLPSSEFQSLAGGFVVFLQSIQTGRAALVYQCLRVHGMSQKIQWLYRIYPEWPQQGYLQALEALRRMCQGLCVLHRTLFASAECGCLLLSATGSGLVRLHHCPCGTPKWVKTRLAASLRQGLMVILSAKSIHA